METLALQGATEITAAVDIRLATGPQQWCGHGDSGAVEKCGDGVEPPPSQPNTLVVVGHCIEDVALPPAVGQRPYSSAW